MQKEAKLREFGIPALVEVPAAATLTDVVFGSAGGATSDQDRVMLRRQDAAGSWSDVTAAQFAGEVRALAKGLMTAGVGAGDRVGLMSRTSYAWTVADYAIWTIGAVTVPVYETSSAEQVEWILANSGAVAVFAETAAHADTIAGVRSSLPDLKDLWPMEESIAELSSAVSPGESGSGQAGPL